jgi:hypothetical protein
MARSFLLRTLMYAGAIDALAEHAPHAIRDADQVGDRFSSAFLRATVMTYLGLAADEPARVEANLKQVEAWLPKTTFVAQSYQCAWGRALLDLYRGEPERAFETVTTMWPTLHTTLLLRTRTMRIEAHDLCGTTAIAAASVARAPDAAIGYARTAADVLEREEVAWARGGAEMIRAGLAKITGDVDRARAHLEGAERAYGRAKMPMRAAGASWARARLLGGQQGADLERAARARLLGVVAIERWMRVFAPGFATPTDA